MKIRADKDILKFLMASMGMALAGVLLFEYVSPFMGGGLIIGGLILTVMGLYVASKPKEELHVDNLCGSSLCCRTYGLSWQER